MLGKCAVSAGSVKVGRPAKGSLDSNSLFNWSSYWATRYPSGLTVTIDSLTQVTLNWINNGSGWDSIRIEQSTDNITYSEVTTATASATTKIISGLSGEPLYYFRLRYLKGSHYSAYCDEATAFIPNFDSGAVSVYDFINTSKITKDGSDLVSEVFDFKTQSRVITQKFANGGGGDQTNWVDTDGNGTADDVIAWQGTNSIITDFDGTLRAQKNIGGASYGGFRLSGFTSGKLYKLTVIYQSDADITINFGGALMATLPNTSGLTSTVITYFVSDGTGMYVFTTGTGKISSYRVFSVQEMANDLYAPSANKPLWSSNKVAFDGVNDYLKAIFTTVKTQPLTIYMVLNPKTVTANDLIFDGLDATNRIFLSQISTGVEKYNLYAGNNVELYPELKTGEKQIITIYAKGADSYLRVNKGNAGLTQNIGTKGLGGLFVGSSSTPGSFSDTEYCDIIVRGDDSIATQNKIITGLAQKNNISVANPVYTPNTLAVLGDSTVALYGGNPSVASLLSFASSAITDISHPGDSISAQQVLWKALTMNNRKSIDCVIIQVGLNDFNGSTVSATVIGYYQTLVAKIKSDINETCKIVISTMTPAKQRYIDLYGAPGGANAYQNWLDLNEAIRGAGATPILGTDGYINSHTTALNDGSGNLDAAYDTGDHIHPNLAGRQVMADAWDVKLNALFP